MSSRKVQFIKAIVNTCSMRRIKRVSSFLASAIVATSLVGCGGSSSDSESAGYLKFYNASNNSPYVYLSLDENNLAGAYFGQSAGVYTLTTASYEMALYFKESSNDFHTFDEQTLQVTNDQVNLVMLTGDIQSPVVMTYQYEDEDPETEEDIFTFRFINQYQQTSALDVHIAKDGETFNEAVKLGSYSPLEMSDSQYFELQSYKFYLTQPGSSEVLYESADIDFLYTTQYIFVIRENGGASDSAFVIDMLAKTTAVVAYPDKNAGAQLKIYNGLTPHDLLPGFSAKIDVSLNGLNANESVTALDKGQFSEVLDISFGDYALDISAAGEVTPLAENFFLSLTANDDKTLFIYQTEVEEADDGDANTTEEVTLYVNTLPVNNSQRVSLYDHQINVINLVDDYTSLKIYFVRSNETVSTAANHLSSTRANPQTITLENNSYDVSILVDENESELLLAFDQLSLDSQSGDLYMIIEEDESSDSGYTVKLLPQNTD
ncbi:MAG: hypothetical protein HRT35_16580 [Algicola sp.]|nr:hypothetical protein [Algicola sp.]